jgi:hypothetical protein
VLLVSFSALLSYTQIAKSQVEPFEVNNKVPLTRTISQLTGIRVQAFRNTVRERDRRCVIAREEVAIAAASQISPWT